MISSLSTKSFLQTHSLLRKTSRSTYGSCLFAPCLFLFSSCAPGWSQTGNPSVSASQVFILNISGIGCLMRFWVISSVSSSLETSPGGQGVETIDPMPTRTGDEDGRVCDELRSHYNSFAAFCSLSVLCPCEAELCQSPGSSWLLTPFLCPVHSVESSGRKISRLLGYLEI